jgi:nucleoside-diphosphate-sugar epimerase
MSRILVTGPSGFVGQAVISDLSAAGHEVIGAFHRPERKPKGVARPVLTGPLQTANWSIALQGVEAIVHLAARVHRMKDTASDPLAEFRLVNRDATRRLAEAAAEHGVKRLVFMSTVKAAVDSTGLDPVDESVKPTPQTPYGISKWEAEQALLDIAGRTSLTPIILRPPLVYGPGVKGNLLALFGLAGRGFPLPFAAIDNARSLVGLSNLASAVRHALEVDPDAGHTYFVSDDTLSTPDLLRAFIAASHSRTRLFSIDPGWLKAIAGMAGKSAAIDRLTESLAIDSSRFRATGWMPDTPLHVELERLAKSLYPSRER